MSDLSVIWEDDALKLLEGRDRYTRNAIREEFRRDPQKDAIEFDPAHNTFLTPVSDSRFSVVWRLNEEGQQAVVRAVVPLTNIPLDVVELKKPEAMSRLKDYVLRAVKAESKGEIQI
ncbi:MAG: hypothetical protein HY655_08750 [Acidobacteria bacterium]|nr:hypothetical protein [Acidobacteriota bacterium]